MLDNPLLVISKKTYLDWQQTLRYTDKLHGSICFFCHIPQCDDTLHPTFEEQAGSCEYQDILSGTALAIYNHEQWKCRAQKNFVCHWLTFAHFTAWLNGKPVAGHKTNMSALFLWYSSTLEH
jgi:hypothetical protein